MRLWKMFKRKLDKHRPDNNPSSASDGQTSVGSDITTNAAWLNNTFSNCQDVKFQKLTFAQDAGEIAVLLIYCEGLSDTKRINQVIIPSLQQFFAEKAGPLDEQLLLNTWHLSSLEKEKVLDRLIPKVFGGELILFFDGLAAAYTIDLANPPQRKPEETNTEISIRGPRDGFIEELSVNVALIRKRLKTNSLTYEKFTLGKRSLTKTGLLYLKDVIRPEVVEEVRDQLSKINIDAIYSTNELEEFLVKHSFALFPLFDYTGRPDFVVASLLRGRFAIIVDGVPTALIAPANITMLFKSPEDIHLSYSFVAFQRLFRIIGLLISLLLPGFYVGIASYHQDQIPLTLLATLVMARKGTPLPTPVEATIILFLFELFREAGLRLPSTIGQTLSVVGGLIIGDAAIRAGLASPSMLVVIATTAVATFTLVNQSLGGTVSILRVGVLFASSLLGIYGFLLSVFAILVYLANQRSFGLPYLAPISPFYFRDFLHAVLRVPATKLNKRPEMLEPVDSTRQEENP